MERSQRRFNTLVAVSKQARIAKSNGQTKVEPGRFKKRHAMDCGNPQCGLCGNPRRSGSKDARTIQELRHDAMVRAEQHAELGELAEVE